MKSLWSDEEAQQYAGPLGPRVYSSRLLGRDKSLVLHGGGNTSVKRVERNLLGDDEEILHIKGSGWDLESIEAAGFAPVRLAPLRRLAALPALPDPEMVNALATQLTRAGAPAPSVETLLHALLPHAYVDHTHADAVLSVTNAPEGARRIREIYGDRVVVIPYVMPGFDLAAACAREFPRQCTARTTGMILMNHGIFSFGADARESYERMIGLVGEAEEYLRSRKCWTVAFPPAAAAPEAQGTPRLELAQLRSKISGAAGAPMLLSVRDEAPFRAFARHAQVSRISQQGPATPDHVIRTKRLPMLGRDVEAYVRDYQAYFERNAPLAREAKTMLDPAPRMVLDPAFGFAAAGRSARDADIVAELYAHSIEVFLRAEALGAWQALPERELFEMEYWDLEQAKLRKTGAAPMFGGEVALVTGAASGIGRACVESFLRRGAAVVGLDRNPAIGSLHARPDYLGLRCELDDTAALEAALEAAVRRFGGVDMLVLNAGVFPPACALESLSGEAWRGTMAINAEAPLRLMQACHPLLGLAPGGGRIVVIGSKNVAAPGPGAAAYSASKAALNQLARVAALEWGRQGIRVNSVHPDAVYDTALWTPALLAERAAAYGLGIEAYKTRNLLKTEIRAHDVAELAAEMCGPLFAKTTAAQVPVDGGNERVL
jgi:rhamnose utilization protein RhaD (predicted bifunctional aldolase and dehydrogenase)/NAD(P)-dependent dehydrogenase (short-subunit alcohol dehydrogenase family)